jgi:sugar/nucleoside kinase (ribokinase family)
VSPAALVCTLGDLLLDVVVRPRTALAPGDDTPAETRVDAGGQAANVAAWAAWLGAEARFVGRRADDAAGRLAAAGLSARGVRVLGPAGPGRTGTVVSLVDGAGERTMASDRGVSPELRPEDVDPSWISGCAALHISGYALVASPIDAAAAAAARLAHAAGARVSVDLASAGAIAGAGADRVRAALAELEPDLLLATEAERGALGGDLPAPAWVLKRGARGVVVSDGGRRLELPAPAGLVIDTTGAGDALAAGVVLGGGLKDAAARGLRAAAACVARVGAMP